MWIEPSATQPPAIPALFHNLEGLTTTGANPPMQPTVMYPPQSLPYTGVALPQQFPAQGQPYIPPPRLTANESSETIPPENRYIRKIGSTPGTLERFRRIVGKQQSLHAEKNHKIPAWLDADFLYQVNFGPAKRELVDRCRAYINESMELPGGRRSLTLLDREMAKILYLSLFPTVPTDTFKTDWNEGEEYDVASESLTPFDYSVSEEMDALMRFEDFVVFTLWSSVYSSSLQGRDRPPMAAVARDIVSLVSSLSLSQMPPGMGPPLTATPRPILEVLKDFCSQQALFCLSSEVRQAITVKDINSDLGILVDMLTIGVALDRSDYGRDDLIGAPKGNSPSNVFSGVTDLAFMMWPGPDILKLGKRPVEPEAFKDLWGTLDDVTASFIHSGPYRIQLSESRAKHLTLDSNGKLRIFWEGPEFWKLRGDRWPLVPGSHTFMKYKNHTLGKLLKANGLYDEILRTYALLFTRDEASKRIAAKLFQDRGATLLIASRKNVKQVEKSEIDSHPVNGSSRRRIFRSFTSSKQLLKEDKPVNPQIVLKTIDGKIHPGTNLYKCVIIPEWSIFFHGQLPMYTHFDYYRGHVALVKNQMAQWKPQTAGELFQAGYGDRFGWYATWVSIVFACLGLVAIVCGILQTYWGYQATQATLLSLHLQQQQS